MKKELAIWQAAHAAEADFWKRAIPLLESTKGMVNHLNNHVTSFDSVAALLKVCTVKNALEIGVGPTGIGALPFLLDDTELIGIDPIARLDFHCLDPLLDAYVQRLRSRVEYRQMMGEVLEFEDSSFDLVASHNALDHAKNPLQILAEAYRILKPNGHLLLAVDTFSLAGLMKYHALKAVRSKEFYYVAHPHAYTHAVLRSALTKLGFRIMAEVGTKESLLGHSRISKFLAKRMG